MDPSLVVIGREAGETSRGPMAVGELVRLPLVEALQLTQAGKVTLADWSEQQEQPIAVPKKGRYLRRDLRAKR